MAPRFWSKQWLDECVKKANSDEEYLKKTAKYSAKTWVVITDYPGGNDVSVKFTYDKGKVPELVYETAPAPSHFRIGSSHWDEKISLFRVQASYETWAKIQKREVTVMAAMSAKLYLTEGDLMKMMQVLGYITAFADLQATIPCEY